jgi:hypothetical protein
LALAIGKERVHMMPGRDVVWSNIVLRVKVLRLVDDAAHHPIRRRDEDSVKSINCALLRLAVLTHVGEAANHDMCEYVWVNGRRPVFQLQALVEVVKVLLDSVTVS